jgi:hypothetical protein
LASLHSSSLLDFFIRNLCRLDREVKKFTIRNISDWFRTEIDRIDISTGAGLPWMNAAMLDEGTNALKETAGRNGFRKNNERVHMTGKVMLTVLFSALLVPATGMADETTIKERFQPEAPGHKFGDRETTIDAFGTLRWAEGTDVSDGRLGVGVGVNHFFNYYLGASAETGVDKLDWPNHVDFSVIGRYPIEKWSLAPYGFLGFGRVFHDTPQWTFHFGIGVDYRLNPKTGLFTDLRETEADVSRNSTLWRFGIRFAF